MSGDITALLGRIRNGDPAASSELLPIVYGELHRLARTHLRGERREHTLQPTALVNEAYLRMFEGRAPEFPDRAHFLAFASGIMRRILVDYARTRGARKRAGDEQRVEWHDNIAAGIDGVDAQLQFLEIDRALSALSEKYPDHARLIEMRYFGGLTAEESALVLGLSVNVVQHDLRFAHAWLRRKLSPADESHGDQREARE